MNDDQPTESAPKMQRLLTMLHADPGNGSLRRQCSEAAIGSGRFDVAVRLADEALILDPADTGALFDKANGLIGQREYSAAIAVLEQVQALVGPDPAIRQNLALCHYCAGEFERARAHLEECYRAGVRSPGSLRLLVSSLHQLSLMDAAVKVALDNEAAGALDGALAGVYALLFLDVDDITRAAKWARTALRLNPQSLEGRLTEATLLTARMQTDPAKQLLESVVNDAPATGRAWIGLGTLALLEQQLDQAKRHFTRGLETLSGHVGSWHVLAWAQLLSGELPAAERSFERALELDRNFAETHGGLAAVAAVRGDTERARRQVEVALRLDPQCLAARFAQAVLSGRAGDPARAQRIIDDAVAGLAAKDQSALRKLLLKPPKR